VHQPLSLSLSFLRRRQQQQQRKKRRQQQQEKKTKKAAILGSRSKLLRAPKKSLPPAP
jgi:hypothetical protein